MTKSKVIKLHNSDVDDVLDEVSACDMDEIMVIGKGKDGRYRAFDSANMSLQTMAIGLALMQAEVMKETGRLLGPEHFEGMIEE